MANDKTSRRGVNICCGVTAIFLVISVVVITTLSLTIFKPKRPEITAHPLGLENITYSGFPNVTLNVTLGMVVTIKNRNYGSFKFKNTTAYVSYHGDTVAEVPIEAELIPARGTINITTSADLLADKLIENPNFWVDIEAGCLSLTSTAALDGKVSVFKILKLHATAHSSCDISVWIKTQTVDSTCNSKFKL